mgnify:CR=1 FL=1
MDDDGGVEQGEVDREADEAPLDADDEMIDELTDSDGSNRTEYWQQILLKVCFPRHRLYDPLTLALTPPLNHAARVRVQQGGVCNAEARGPVLGAASDDRASDDGIRARVVRVAVSPRRRMQQCATDSYHACMHCRMFDQFL